MNKNHSLLVSIEITQTRYSTIRFLTSSFVDLLQFQVPQPSEHNISFVKKFRVHNYTSSINPQGSDFAAYTLSKERSD
jgi:hypothetical protein